VETSTRTGETDQGVTEREKNIAGKMKVKSIGAIETPTLKCCPLPI
jgi:hypothetical protein